MASKKTSRSSLAPVSEAVDENSSQRTASPERLNAGKKRSAVGFQIGDSGRHNEERDYGATQEGNDAKKKQKKKGKKSTLDLIAMTVSMGGSQVRYYIRQCFEKLYMLIQSRQMVISIDRLGKLCMLYGCVVCSSNNVSVD